MTVDIEGSLLHYTKNFSRSAVTVEVLMDGAMLRRPTALIPLAMSVAALATVVGYAMIFGARQADEGAAAHVWELLMSDRCR
jgi:hypothetical protein